MFSNECLEIEAFLRILAFTSIELSITKLNHDAVLQQDR